jgi:hypothetical protein
VCVILLRLSGHGKMSVFRSGSRRSSPSPPLYISRHCFFSFFVFPTRSVRTETGTQTRRRQRSCNQPRQYKDCEKEMSWLRWTSLRDQHGFASSALSLRPRAYEYKLKCHESYPRLYVLRRHVPMLVSHYHWVLRRSQTPRSMPYITGLLAGQSRLVSRTIHVVHDAACARSVHMYWTDLPR